MTSKRILCLTTGGTIVGDGTPGRRGKAQKKLDGELLKPSFERARAHIQKTWRLDVVTHPQFVEGGDSSHITPSLWTDLANAIQASYDDYDAFLVTHGTNTMGYTAAALSFAIANSYKPIVITGSQIPIDAPSSDALANIENAVRVCVFPHERIGGVVCLFGGHLITGPRVKKSSDFDIDAFGAAPTGRLARLGRSLEIDEANLARHRRKLSSRNEDMTARDLRVRPRFDLSRVLSLTEFPGLDAGVLLKMVDAACEDGPLKGVILRAFGSGDVGRDRIPLLKRLRELDVPVVVTTQVPNGRATMDVNKPGQQVFEAGLAVPMGDMSIEAMTTKLGWLIARGDSCSKVRKEMARNLRGEIADAAEPTW